MTVAPVGLDFEVMKKDFKKYDKGLLRAQFGFDMDEVIICTVSRLDPEKRPLDLLDIFMRVKAKKKCKLLIVGEGVQSLEVEKRIEVLGLENEVKVLNRVPYEDIWKVYAISDYFVNLCGTEIFGMAILEAMYYEVSVAASIAPGPSVTLKGMKGHKLCITDQDVEDWLAGKYPEKKELAESAEKLKEKYGWDSCANVFLSIVSGKKDKNRKEKRTRV
ncbi:MAG: glycosyltransferase [Eubacteriales bacterium]|nr:glycosyltransferase [Eubacteriales bacterium]